MRGVQLPRRFTMDIQVTLRSGREHKATRQVSVEYPKKLYPFEMGRELHGFITSFKYMAKAMREAHREFNERFSRKLVLQRRRAKRVSNPLGIPARRAARVKRAR